MGLAIVSTAPEYPLVAQQGVSSGIGVGDRGRSAWTAAQGPGGQGVGFRAFLSFRKGQKV